MNNPKFRCWDKVKQVFADEGFHLIGETIIFGMAPFQRCSVEDLNNFEIQQWTGLKDKNGKDIYDGDIVSWCDREEILEIQWCQEYVRFGGLIHKQDDKIVENDCFRWFDDHGMDKLEIIGNVFENLKLLT